MGVLVQRAVELTVAATSPEKVRVGALVVGAFADGTFPEPAQKIDAVSKGRLSAILKLGDLGEKAGSTLMVYGLPNVAANRILLVSFGGAEQFGEQAFRNAVSGASRALGDCAARDVAVTLSDVDI